MDKAKHKGKSKKSGRKRLTVSVICKAVRGKTKALEKVLEHYKPYITKLATRKLMDDSGNVSYYVDNEVFQTLECKLITEILKFKIVITA